jgi:hypothetical protein
MIRTLAQALFLMGMPLLAAAAQDPAGDAEKKGDEEAQTRITEFRKELKGCRTPEDICMALRGLCSIRHPKILAELWTWVQKPEANICGEAAEQISKYEKNRMAADMLIAAARGRRDSEGLAKCLRYAGDVKCRSIVPSLHPYLRHKDVNVAREAACSLGKLGAALSIEPLIKLAREVDANIPEGSADGAPLPGLSGPGMDDARQRRDALMPAVYQALKNITGEIWKNPKDWDSWWKKHKNTFKERE